MKTFELLDKDRIKENLTSKKIGRRLVIFKSTASTNDIGWEYAKADNSDGLTIFAESQTAGRGRRNNKWLSDEGMGLLLSVVLKANKITAETLNLTIAVALTEAIAKNGCSAKIKWPNDIYINGKKAAGILIESKTSHKKTDYVVGIGINCHQKIDDFPDDIRHSATSIDIETAEICNRNKIAADVLNQIDLWLTKDKSRIAERWRQKCSQIGERIELEFDKNRFIGNCIDIDPERGLILQIEGGGVRVFQAAQTTIIKR